MHGDYSISYFCFVGKPRKLIITKLSLGSSSVLIILLVTFISNDENPRCNNKFTWCCHEAKLVQVYYFKKYDKRHAIQLSKTWNKIVQTLHQIHILYAYQNWQHFEINACPSSCNIFVCFKKPILWSGCWQKSYHSNI